MKRPRTPKRRAPPPATPATGTSTRPLPGMEHRQIKPLEDVVRDLVHVRAQRQILILREIDLKARARRLLHEYDKTAYIREGIELVLIPGEESVRVRVTKGTADDHTPNLSDYDKPIEGDAD